MQIQQTQARNQTERAIATATKEILAVYDDARKSINAELQQLYAKHLTGIAPEDYYVTIIKYDRLNKTLAEIDKLYIAESVKAGRMTVAASKTAMTDAYYKNQYVLDWFTPNIDINLSFTAIPPELVNLSVTGNLANWEKLSTAVKGRITSIFGSVNSYIPQEGSLSAILAQNRRDDVLKINRAISSGLLQGDGYQKTARSILDIFGAVGKEKSSGIMGRALKVVRTESNRTYNAGAFANSQAVADQGIDIRRVWVATLDARTRDRHAALDGQSVGPDEPFELGGESAMYPGDFPSAGMNINCRCTTIDAIDGIPPSARLGVNPETGEYEVFDWTIYDEWKKSNGVT